ncbi:MAG: single-stranded-DNA-specific exonuclease RecJ [Gemmatimonadaceae bacterium]|nr:single-stranded-DNA-specific exonuclease RecJ [Chitinophagaceae bacterium]
MEKRWKINEADKDLVTSLQESLKINRTLCEILVSRGISDFETARHFFRPSISDLHDPWLMKDMEKAVTRIERAMQQKEKILVFGDYDVDGTTAVAGMYQFLRGIHDPALLDFYIPHRYREGYGVSTKGIDYAIENGFTLIISLDCGIKSVDHIRYALRAGIEFIICDHHLPDAELPPAVAILNPKQADCNYPFKDLCGCGVGIKLMMAISMRLGLPDESWQRYLDLAATAIAADIVSMSGENRILAFFGLIKVNENPCAGIKALLELSGYHEHNLTITNLVYLIAPRINAAGRMDDARKAVLLFIEGDYTKALGFATMLQNDNTDRKEEDKSITIEALELISKDSDHVNRRSTVLFQPHWHKGVVGIVASRLIETYYRPTIVLTRSGDLVAGSARSVIGFNLYEAVHACREHLIGYGGHFAAAGMTMHPEQVEEFCKKFEATVAATIEPHQLIPEICIDAFVQFSDINAGFYNILSQMEPFGPDNPRPVFLAKKVVDNGWSKIVKEEHIRFSLSQNNVQMSGIGFGMAARFEMLTSRQPIDVVFTLDENDYNGNKSLQLRVIDFRMSDV